MSRDNYHQIASVTKSFTSAMIGIAIKEGAIKHIDQRVERFFSTYPAKKRAPQFGDITIRHLLMMMAGFEWSDWAGTGFQKWLLSDDPVRLALEMPMSHAPGQHYNYNTPASHLLSAIFTKATGKTLLDFANDRVFAPLGIANCSWPTDSQGNNFGGHGISLRSRDLAKFGYLYLNGGLWDGRQIIPTDWVNASTQPQSRGGEPEKEQYGYLWWVTTLKGHAAYFGGGFGGQFIYVIPDLDIVVVITSNLDRPHMENRRIIKKFIVPAVLK